MAASGNISWVYDPSLVSYALEQAERLISHAITNKVVHNFAWNPLLFIKIKKYYANCHQQLVANLSLILQTVPSSSSVQPVVDLTGKGNCIIVTLLNCNIYFLLLPVLPGFLNQTTIAMMK